MQIALHVARSDPPECILSKAALENMLDVVSGTCATSHA